MVATVGTIIAGGGGSRVNKNKRQSLSLEQYLTEDWNPTTLIFGYIDQSRDQVTHTYHLSQNY